MRGVFHAYLFIICSITLIIQNLQCINLTYLYITCFKIENFCLLHHPPSVLSKVVLLLLCGWELLD